MLAEEWDRLKFYTATDSDGNLATDTSKLLKGCKNKKNGYRQCSVKLGYYNNYKELGLSTPW